MTRFFAFALFFLAALSLGVAPAVHAAEREICVESNETDHVGEVDQEQPDSSAPEKGIQHQHSSCHGHHIAPLSSDLASGDYAPARSIDALGATAKLNGAVLDPALRPPQA